MSALAYSILHIFSWRARRSLVSALSQIISILLVNRKQFTLASTIYFTLSRHFPAHETMLDHAIFEQEALPYDGSIPSGDKKRADVYQVDESAVA